MKVEEVMNDEVVVMQESEPVEYARKLMLKHGFSRIVIVDKDGLPVGIVTERDLTKKLRGNGPAWRRRPIDKISIRRVMSNNLITTTPEAELKDVVELMIKNDISSIPIIEKDELAGIITKTDLMKFYSDKFQGRWKVSDLMTPEVITVSENHAINHVISIIEEKNIGKIVVLRDNQPVGIITPENISFAHVEDPETGVSVEKIYFVRRTNGTSKKNVRLVSMLTAGDIMTDDLLIIGRDEDAARAARIMMDENISGIPVVDDGYLAGIITKTDIIKGIQ